MAASNLLNTRSINFQELLGNGTNYKVPPYQRDYSWTEEQWEDLWQDVLELRSDQDGRHYMGAVVVKAENDRQFLVIDGQQRMATLSILGLAVINRLKNLGISQEASENSERAVALRSRYIGEKDPASLTEISKLTLNEHDNGFYQDYLVQLRTPSNPRSLAKSNRLLWECFEYFQRQLTANKDLSSNGLKLAELLSEVVARRLMFILISVDDEINAYTVFETLNARGLELTTTDLLKNYLFSRLHAQIDLEATQRRWQKLTRTVHQEHFGEFLRYYYLLRQPKIRTGRLFKMVRDEIKTPADVLKLLTNLEDRAELFEAISDHHHPFWNDYPGAEEYVKELNLFRVRQMTPLIFAAFEKLDKLEFVKTLKVISVISFRYTVVSGLNTNELEPTYHNAAAAVLNGQAMTAHAVFEILKPIYVSDEKFETDFSQLSLPTAGQRKKIVKYILCKLDNDQTKGLRDFETDPGTIEHILPENPGAEWSELIPPEKWESLKYRLGNLTLMLSSENRMAGNGLIDTKSAIYANSGYKITMQVAERYPAEWNEHKIIERQKKMAFRATHVWRSDFTI